MLDVGKLLISSYLLPILAITDGPGNAFLLERLDTQNIKLTRYNIPALKDVISDIDLICDSPATHSSSLPVATGDAFLNRVTSVGNMTMFAKKELLLNPLGAGDSCSAVFLLEYLDTRVYILQLLMLYRMQYLLFSMDWPLHRLVVLLWITLPILNFACNENFLI